MTSGVMRMSPAAAMVMVSPSFAFITGSVSTGMVSSPALPFCQRAKTRMAVSSRKMVKSQGNPRRLRRLRTFLLFCSGMKHTSKIHEIHIFYYILTADTRRIFPVSIRLSYRP